MDVDFINWEKLSASPIIPSSMFAGTSSGNSNTTTTTAIMQRLFSCNTCTLTFHNSETYRQHARSPEHIAQLRKKAVAAGAEMRQPSASPSSSSCSSYASSSASDSESETETPTFTPGECLFCEEVCDSFDDSIVHMASTHSFIVPFQDSLNIDLETLIWYFHLVIFGYHECLLCGKRRINALSVQQHMRAAGHCRFEVNGEVTEFYDMSALEKRIVDRQLQLPSGKVATQRGFSSHKRAARPKMHTKPQADTIDAPVYATGKEVMDKKERKLGVLTAHMAQLSVQDQMALAHLPASGQRTALATRKKQLDRARREERRARISVERKGNKTLQANYRAAGPERPNG